MVTTGVVTTGGVTTGDVTIGAVGAITAFPPPVETGIVDETGFGDVVIMALPAPVETDAVDLGGFGEAEAADFGSGAFMRKGSHPLMIWTERTLPEKQKLE